MTHLILLEQDPVQAMELSELLGRNGYITTTVQSLAAFEQRFDAQLHPMAIIDPNLPDGDGLKLIRRLRQAGHRLGIVVLSARADVSCKVAALSHGADHFLSKGCDLDELAAVLESLRWRLNLGRSEERWLLEPGPRRLQVPGSGPVRLSQQDLLVLRCLMSQAGNNVSRQSVIEALDQDYLSYDQRRLDSQIRRLRRNIEECSGQTLPIKTLRNVGFCFYAPASIQA